MLEYPCASRRFGEPGRVVLRVLVGPDGLAEMIELHEASAFARPDDAAIEAALRARYKPYPEDGVAQPALGAGGVVVSVAALRTAFLRRQWFDAARTCWTGPSTPEGNAPTSVVLTAGVRMFIALPAIALRAATGAPATAPAPA